MPTDAANSPVPAEPGDAPGPVTGPTQLDAAQLERWAQYLANHDDDAWPADLSAEQAAELLRLVRRLRRQRLITVVARLIASELRDSHGG